MGTWSEKDPVVQGCHPYTPYSVQNGPTKVERVCGAEVGSRDLLKNHLLALWLNLHTNATVVTHKRRGSHTLNLFVCVRLC